MENRDDIQAFLTACRARITPAQAGVPLFGGKRRVPGLRREEVAMMAGVSTDYYTRLERGNLTGVSGSVLNAVATALHLDDAETAHLFDLSRSANAGRNPYDRFLSDLVGELSTRSDEFRIRWAAHRVSLHHTGAKTFAHPTVGNLDLIYNALDLPADPGLTLTISNAARGSATEEKLRLLASWVLTQTDVTFPAMALGPAS